MRRVVVDTNVWVSALLNPEGYPARVLAALEASKFVLIASEPLFTELSEVLARPRIARKYHVTRATARALISRLRRRATVVPVTGALRLCRDPDDDMVLETAASGRANTLVTRDDDLKGDSDLVPLLESAGIEVFTVRRLLEELDFVVDYREFTERFEAALDPTFRISFSPLHFTREVSYEGVVRRVQVYPEGRVLWLAIDVFDPEHPEGSDPFFPDQLWLKADSGQLGDFLEDLHSLGIHVKTPHDLVGLRLTWEYGHGYSTEGGARLRIPQ
ncbi:MAG: putative toxin-antitoxin system toxin component, PIN family [Chloroflexi bacterium]|nr:putative toxin-antitoxin system toxin component, PIN family [Chloroflexota bacterium]